MTSSMCDGLSILSLKTSREPRVRTSCSLWRMRVSNAYGPQDTTKANTKRQSRFCEPTSFFQNNHYFFFFSYLAKEISFTIKQNNLKHIDKDSLSNSFLYYSRL